MICGLGLTSCEPCLMTFSFFGGRHCHSSLWFTYLTPCSVCTVAYTHHQARRAGGCLFSDWQMSYRTPDKRHTLEHHGGPAQPARLVFLLVRGQGQDQPLPLANPGLSLPAPLWRPVLANFRCEFPDRGIFLPSHASLTLSGFHGLRGARSLISSLHPTPWACVGPV